MIEVMLGAALLTGLVLMLALLVIGARAVLLPSREVTITVNGGTRIVGRTGLKLLSVLNDNGVLLPSACAGAGTCGLCRVTVTKGGAEPLPTEAARLTRADIRAGLHLACQVVVRGDMTLEVPADLVNAESFEGTVRSTRFLAPLIKEIVVDLPQENVVALPAGAFFQVTAPPYACSFSEWDVPPAYHEAWVSLRGLQAGSAGQVTRAYSIANRPADERCIVFNVRLALPPPDKAEAPPGIVSSYLFGVSSGTRLTLSGPFGSFRIKETAREMVFIGGGVGMAPLRALIFEQLEARGTNRKISYFYGARSRVEVFYAEDFDGLAAKHPNFGWTVALSDPKPEDEWDGPVGFIHTVAFQTYLGDHPAPEACEYYLCGPPLMIKAVLAMLDEAGVPPDMIHNDDFGG